MEHVTFCGGEISIIAELLRNRIRELDIVIEETDDEDEKNGYCDEIFEMKLMLQEIERQTGWKVRAAE